MNKESQEVQTECKATQGDWIIVRRPAPSKNSKSLNANSKILSIEVHKETVSGRHVDFIATLDDNNIANAQIIACAPQALKQLKQLSVFIEKIEPDTKNPEHWMKWFGQIKPQVDELLKKVNA